METRARFIAPDAGKALRTPRAAAIAGIIFSLLLGLCFVIFRLALPQTLNATEPWLSDGAGKTAVLFALGLAPFAGIAFLWFIAVVRDRMGAREDRFFASVFLGSGLLFVAMFFSAIAVAVGLMSEQVITPEIWQFGHSIMAILADYAIKMAAVFMVVTATITLRIEIMPNSLGWLGYAIAVVLLLGSGFLPWTELLFPLWVLLVSIRMLDASLHREQREASGEVANGANATAVNTHKAQAT